MPLFKSSLREASYAKCLHLIRVPPLRLDPAQEAINHKGRLAGRTRLGSAACLIYFWCCVSFSALSLLDSTDKPMLKWLVWSIKHEFAEWLSMLKLNLHRISHQYPRFDQSGKSQPMTDALQGFARVLKAFRGQAMSRLFTPVAVLVESRWLVCEEKRLRDGNKATLPRRVLEPLLGGSPFGCALRMRRCGRRHRTIASAPLSAWLTSDSRYRIKDAGLRNRETNLFLPSDAVRFLTLMRNCQSSAMHWIFPLFEGGVNAESQPRHACRVLGLDCLLATGRSPELLRISPAVRRSVQVSWSESPVHSYTIFRDLWVKDFFCEGPIISSRWLQKVVVLQH